jgi:NADH:ubiquinone oxidoreductase subunit 3 (subunit A)
MTASRGGQPSNLQEWRNDMNWILLAIGYIIIDINVWHLDTLHYIFVQVGCMCIYIAGAESMR